MSRGLVIGAFWRDINGEHVEHVLAVPDARVREGLDRIVAAVPEHDRADVAHFLAPLLENNEPAKQSQGLQSTRFGIVWWKRAFVWELT